MVLSQADEPDRAPKIYLVRHGETAWTISGQHTGRTDIPLTERGERDAQELSARLRGMTFANVHTSPLQRARRTGELAGFDAQAEADSDLMEWDYRAYEGWRTADILAERPGWRLFEAGCPGGETVDAVGARADRVTARVRACAGDVLLFAHPISFASSRPVGLASPPEKAAISIGCSPRPPPCPCTI